MLILAFMLAQATPIHGQDPMQAGSDQGPSGWVQAPVPRGVNAPQQGARGAPKGGQHPADKAGQGKPGENPGTPVANPLPGPGGIAPKRD
jgi:hypothetical protein